MDTQRRHWFHESARWPAASVTCGTRHGTQSGLADRPQRHAQHAAPSQQVREADTREKLQYPLVQRFPQIMSQTVTRSTRSTSAPAPAGAIVYRRDNIGKRNIGRRSREPENMFRPDTAHQQAACAQPQQQLAQICVRQRLSPREFRQRERFGVPRHIQHGGHGISCSVGQLQASTPAEPRHGLTAGVRPATETCQLFRRADCLGSTGSICGSISGNGASSTAPPSFFTSWQVSSSFLSSR